MATPMPAMIQNRTTMLTSLQPASSKWCCSGTIRNTRLPVVWNEMIWMTTVIVMITKSTPMIGSSRTVRVRHGQTGDQAAERQRAGVAHEDPRRGGVPPQEADAGRRPPPPAIIAISSGSRTS